LTLHWRRDTHAKLYFCTFTGVYPRIGEVVTPGVYFLLHFIFRLSCLPAQIVSFVV